MNVYYVCCAHKLFGVYIAIINVMYTHATHTEFILDWYVFVHIIVLPFGMYIFMYIYSVYNRICSCVFFYIYTSYP